jgi:hypothetical protein
MKYKNKTNTFAEALACNKSNDIHKGKAISVNSCFEFFFINTF